MRRILQTLMLLVTFNFGANAQNKVYVNANAIGNNDGSSWVDAFQDLSDAINNQNVNEIWIAEGIYTPGSGSIDTMSSFFINREMSIYGGFAGTESSLDQREIANHPTILSGDLAGDDISDDLITNKNDNALHVMVVPDSANLVVLDGLDFIRGHNQASRNGLNEFFYRGAGIFSRAKLIVRNCNFYENNGGSGSAVFIRDSNASGSEFSSCNFFGNSASDQGALFMLFASDITIKGCNLYNNSCNRGVVYPNECNNVAISDCYFYNNINQDGFGGAIFNWHSSNVSLKNLIFRNNKAGNGGGIYSDHRNIKLEDQNPDNFIIENCLFEDNVADSYGGGAIRIFSSSMHVKGCTFLRNRASNSGGAFAATGTQKKLQISDCTFELNTAEGGWGGATAVYSDSTFSKFSYCTFKNNTATTSGGAATNGFQSENSYEHCVFESNTARFGGAVFSQNDRTNLSLSDCTFFSNSSTSSGGALSGTSGLSLAVNNCEFTGNQSEIGGGINLSGDTLGISSFELNAGFFNFNIADVQAGAVNISNTNSTITNSVFLNNYANDLGTGGAISVNASGAYPLEVKAINNTFYNNAGDLSGGIATWTDDVAASKLILGNNAFLNGASKNYNIEAGTTIVESLGGNISSDNSMRSFLNQNTDINEMEDDPLFVDPTFDNLQLMANSPLIDKGVKDIAPEFDFNGSKRDDNPDVGAYEFGSSVGTKKVENQPKSIVFTPNPVDDIARFKLVNEWEGSFEIKVFNAQGVLISNFIRKKSSISQEFEFSVNFLVDGIYYIIFQNNEEFFSTILMKKKG